MDANAAGLRELSGRACRARLQNLIYVRSAVESLPCDLAGVADRVTVVLPWGSLLAAVARPAVESLRAIRSLCQPLARLEVVLAPHAVRDFEEWRRLGMSSFDPHRLTAALSPGYAEAGFERMRVRTLGPEEAARWSSTWARRLAHAGDRSLITIEARAVNSVG